MSNLTPSVEAIYVALRDTLTVDNEFYIPDVRRFCESYAGELLIALRSMKEYSSPHEGIRKQYNVSRAYGQNIKIPDAFHAKVLVLKNGDVVYDAVFRPTISYVDEEGFLHYFIADQGTFTPSLYYTHYNIALEKLRDELVSLNLWTDEELHYD